MARAPFSPKLPPLRKFTSIVAAMIPCDASNWHRYRYPGVEFSNGLWLPCANTASGKGPLPRGMQICPLMGTSVLVKGHGVAAPRLANAETLIRPVTYAGSGVL